MIVLNCTIQIFLTSQIFHYIITTDISWNSLFLLFFLKTKTGVRAYGQHPHYMAKCHSCTHHKFMYVALEGNHEPEIVKNLARVMCAMQHLPPDCGQHFIETDCTPFTGLDNKDWFTFTFTMVRVVS